MIRTMPLKSKRLPEGFFYRDLGRNMRVTRSAAGRNQGEVDEHLQVTFQHVQKYEAGTNRIPVASSVCRPKLAKDSSEMTTGTESFFSFIFLYRRTKFQQAIIKEWERHQLLHSCSGLSV
jgi:hypothetical protein